VEGIIVRPLKRIDPVWHYNEQGDLIIIAEAVNRLLIRANGVDDVYPVTIETFHAIWWMETTVQLDCSVLPCTLEK
jgi:hypothetical protein